MAIVEMITTNTYASQAAMRELASRLAARLTTVTVTEHFGTADVVKKAPIVQLEEDGEVVALVTMSALPTDHKNILGLPQTSYSPHVIKVALLADIPETEEDPAVPGIPAKTKYILIGEISRMGAKVEVFEDTDLDEEVFDGTPVAEWFPDFVHGPTASV